MKKCSQRFEELSGQLHELEKTKTLKAYPLTGINYEAVDSELLDEWKIKVKTLLSDAYGKDSEYYKEFSKLLNYSLYDEFDTLVRYRAIFHAAQDDYHGSCCAEDEAAEKQDKKRTSINTVNVFIVHGRDEGVKAQVSSLLQKIELKPIILHEQANEGKTLIEKFERHADVKAAIILFTGDDIGKYKDDKDYERRVRQNVIFEAGYFMGKLGRENTIILAENGLNIQSDLQGYIYIPLDENQRWYLDIARELKTIGFNIDMNKLI